MGEKITALTMAQKTASLGIPMGYVYAIVPACGGMILVYSILNLAQMMGGREGQRYLDGPEREEAKAGKTGKAGEGSIEREKEGSGEWGKRKESDRK